MDHKLKGKWHSYLVSTNEDGSEAEIQQDEQDHVMDLTKIKENGDLDDGKHNGKLLKGKATPISAQGSYFLALDEYESGKVIRRYEGFLVRDKNFGPFNIKLIAGRYILYVGAEIKRGGPVLASQEEGTWVATKP